MCNPLIFVKEKSGIFISCPSFFLAEKYWLSLPVPFFDGIVQMLKKAVVSQLPYYYIPPHCLEVIPVLEVLQKLYKVGSLGKLFEMLGDGITSLSKCLYKHSLYGEKKEIGKRERLATVISACLSGAHCMYQGSGWEPCEFVEVPFFLNSVGCCHSRSTRRPDTNSS